MAEKQEFRQLLRHHSPLPLQGYRNRGNQDRNEDVEIPPRRGSSGGARLRLSARLVDRSREGDRALKVTAPDFVALDGHLASQSLRTNKEISTQRMQCKRTWPALTANGSGTMNITCFLQEHRRLSGRRARLRIVTSASLCNKQASKPRGICTQRTDDLAMSKARGPPGPRGTSRQSRHRTTNQTHDKCLRKDETKAGHRLQECVLAKFAHSPS